MDMADDEEFDFEAFYNKHPNEIKAIGGSLLAYFVVFEPLFQWMWDEGTQCGVWGDDYSCQGSAWLTLAYVAMASIVLVPGIWGGISMFAKNFTYVDEYQRGGVVWMASVVLPFATIWATAWLYCLPHSWGLLPWGSWVFLVVYYLLHLSAYYLLKYLQYLEYPLPQVSLIQC